MHWPAALYAATIWLLLASFWNMYRPLPESALHSAFVVRIVRDVLPALLVAMLAGLLIPR